MKSESLALPDEDHSQWEYANLFWRTIAALLDQIILIVLIVTSTAIILFVFQSLNVPPSRNISLTPAALITPLLSSHIGLIFAGLIIISIPMSCWFYYACFESSAWQASPGMRLCRMIVVNSDGSRLSFRDASYRFLLNMFRAPFAVDLDLIVFTRKRQDLEDMVSETYVLRRKASE